MGVRGKESVTGFYFAHSRSQIMPAMALSLQQPLLLLLVLKCSISIVCGIKAVFASHPK